MWFLLFERKKGRPEEDSLSKKKRAIFYEKKKKKKEQKNKRKKGAFGDNFFIVEKATLRSHWTSQKSNEKCQETSIFTFSRHLGLLATKKFCLHLNITVTLHQKTSNEKKTTTKFVIFRLGISKKGSFTFFTHSKPTVLKTQEKASPKKKNRSLDGGNF